MGGELGAALGTVCMLLLGLFTFVGKNALSKVEALEKRVADQDKDIAVMKAGKLDERVARIETVMAELRSDIRQVVTLLEEQKTHWHNRRREDGEN